MKLIQVGTNDSRLIFEVYKSLRNLENEYANFKDWFFTKVVPGLCTNERKIYVIEENNIIVAVLILKNAEEKKICTLRVAENYRSRGIGTFLLELAFRELHCKQPIITVSSYHIDEFRPLLEKRGFVLFGEYPEYYKKGVTEYSYNGPLNSIIDKQACA